MSKTDELISRLEAYLKYLLKYIPKNERSIRMQNFESEIASLKEQIKKEESNVNFMQIQELTDEQWLKLPKEEILQLYKNCYSMLKKFLASHPKEQSVTDEELKSLLLQFSEYWNTTFDKDPVSHIYSSAIDNFIGLHPNKRKWLADKINGLIPKK